MLKRILLTSAAATVSVVAANAADLPSKKAAPATYVKICDAYGSGFYTIPGTDTCVKVGGYVRVDYDYRPERKNTTYTAAVASAAAVTGNYAQWSTSSTAFATGNGTRLPTGTAGQGAFWVGDAGKGAVSAADAKYGNTAITDNTTSGFYNRGTIQLDARTPTSMGVARTFMALRLETGAGLQGKTKTEASLEAAFIQWAGFTFGQGPQPMAFMSSWAYNTHYWGGWPSGVRQLTYTAVLGGGLSVTAGLTDMGGYSGNTLVTAPPGAVHKPDYNGLVYVGNARLDQSWGSVAVYGGFHTGGNLTGGTQDANGTVVGGTKEAGWALGVGASFKLPMLAAGDELQVTFAYNDRLQTIMGDSGINTPSGSAYGSNPVGGPGVSFANGTGWVAGAQLRHYWSSNFRSQVYGSYTSRTQHNTAAYTGGSGDAWSVGKAFIYTPAKDFDIGLEFNYIRASWDQNAIRSIGLGAATPVTTGFGGHVGSLTESNLVTKLRVQRNF